ncbi:MAG: tryptophan synthase alpha chain [Chloroflexota bacterium]|jgi:tryptophan synthase alpha chain|nr:tryptophan synthase alpha chain [Chloroflexota bacterium]
MSRIGPMFERLRAEGRLGLFPFITTGYPRLDSTPDLALALFDAGADLLELGIPFSDPLAEGRTVQATTYQALRNGVTVARCMEAAAAIRARTEKPLVFMGYINPILAYGMDRFTADAAAAGVDGLIVPDLSMEETAGLHTACQAAGLDLIFFLAPTSTEERVRQVAALASGFIYCISVTGVTGSRDSLGDEVDSLLGRIRAMTSTPLALGFGLSRPEHLRHLEGRVDAAIVGSALLDAIAKADDPAAAGAAFVHWMRGEA